MPLRSRLLAGGFIFIVGFAQLATITVHASTASKYRVGSFLGYGGSGLTQVTRVNGASTIVDRSEGPGVVSIFADRMMTDFYSLGLEHTRGFSFAPFSSGSSFTGVTARWYFWGGAATVGEVDGAETVLLIKRFTPFAGISSGVALADIKRENDLVSNIAGSGLYFGIRLGADYPLSPGIGIRPQFLFSTTIFQSPTLPASLAEFSLGCGIYFFL